MRFLCLHGSGTNSQILETQTAALRYELGEHTYEFVDGMVSCDIAPEIATIYPANADYYSYYDSEPKTCQKALTDLTNYLELEGPFDGIIAFSTGAALATTMLIRHTKSKSGTCLPEPPIKVAIFFSCSTPVDPEMLMEKGIVKFLEADQHDLIKIPTAHIWGAKDKLWRETSESVSRMCAAKKRSVFVHDGGHEIPGGRDKSSILGAVHVIRRAIDAALMAQ